jgi:hypothetical protein
MILVMMDTAGRRRIAELVRAEMARQGLSGPTIDAGGRVSRATVDRVKRGDPRVSDTTLMALGDILGLPRGFLTYVGEADIAKIAASGADPDLVRWTLDLVAESQDWPPTFRDAVNR